MRKVLYFILVLAVAHSCTSKDTRYVIKGKITGADSVTFLVQKRVSGVYVKLDSAMTVNGEFTMKGGKVDYPQIVYLMPKGMRGGLTFYLENSPITINGHIDSLYSARIEGSKTQDEVEELSGQLEPVNNKISDLSGEFRTIQGNDYEEKMAELENQINELYEETDRLRLEFIREHPSSYYAASLLSSMSYSMEADELENFINAMDTAVSNSKSLMDLKAHVEIMKTVARGQKAPDFIMNDVNDNPLSLSSVTGKSKLLLVDFWASWCGLCRQENPNVVKIWEEYNKKGFDVFGVSLDRPGARDSWIQAIKDDKLTWTHVSDLKYWDCAAAKLYAVNAIPANFLLDETGTIIARNLRGEDLRLKVEEILDPK